MLYEVAGQCRAVGVTRLPHGHLPLALVAGELCMLSATGRLIRQPLATHTFRLYSHSVIQGITPSEGAGQQANEQQSATEPPDSGTSATNSERKSNSARKRSAKRDQAVMDLNKLGTSEVSVSRLFFSTHLIA